MLLTRRKRAKETEVSCSVIERDSLKVLISLSLLFRTHLCLEEPFLETPSLQRQAGETMTGCTLSWHSGLGVTSITYLQLRFHPVSSPLFSATLTGLQRRSLDDFSRDYVEEGGTGCFLLNTTSLLVSITLSRVWCLGRQVLAQSFLWTDFSSLTVNIQLNLPPF